MIVFNLRCGGDHVFEAWFKDSATYDQQSAAGEVVCPACGDTKIAKAPMAPRLGKGVGKGKSAGGGEAEQTSGPTANDGKAETGDKAALAVRLRQAIGEIRTHVESNCDYVGPSFAEEARKIHYGETEKRNIYGEASSDEAKSLKDEGVEFGRIPWLPREDA
ncbi:MAG TPA: DUF1178 family protein [Alphaproteobacteria bacterium]|nr:DUF1178 family protein [Alphaproteobacteria bacterium]